MQVVLHVLRKIILTEKNGTFPNKNYFSIQVYNKIREYGLDYLNNKRFIDDIPAQTYDDNQLDDSGEGIKTLEGTKIWDFRFCSFATRGFRMFPFGKNNRYYGLNFVKTNTTNGYPCSLYLVGANGSGKTSLYSSMEHYCTGDVSAAKARGIEKDFYTDYIAHAKSKEKPDTKVFLQENKDQKDKEEVLKSLSNILPAFFCSEHEINDFCGKPEDLTTFFYTQIGYGHIVKLKEHLEEEQSKIEKTIEKEGNEFQPQHQIPLYLKKKLLEGIQTDAIALINWDASKDEKLRFPDVLIFLQGLKKQQIDWNDKGDIKHKRENLKKLILKLNSEKEKILTHYGKASTLLILYNDFIASLKTIVHALSNEQENIFPRRFQRSELEFQLGKIEVKEFQTNRKFILEWYEYIINRFIDEGNEKGAITIIKEISNVLKDLHIDDVTESEETVRSRYEVHRKYLSTLIEGIEAELTNILKEILANTENLKKEILSDFLLPSEDIKFDLSQKKKLVSMIYLKTDGMENDIPFSPREYFNSFRYKFYCILLKIVAAFTVKKSFNLNFPLIFDDIFYSSDFSNRDKVGDFIASIYKIHNEIFKTADSPLQIIFFTHDDLILEAAMKGTSGLDNAICGRLFFYNEVEEDDLKSVEKIEYYNLYIPFTE